MVTGHASGHADRGDAPGVTRCVHCGTSVSDDVVGIPPSVRRLRDHLLGCPAALVAFQPALPIVRDRAALLSQFVFAPAT
jgi:hypothetical protein